MSSKNSPSKIEEENGNVSNVSSSTVDENTSESNVNSSNNTDNGQISQQEQQNLESNPTAENDSEASSPNPINHNTPCKFYQQLGTCKFGFHCRYSHGFSQGPLMTTRLAAAGMPRASSVSSHHGNNNSRQTTVHPRHNNNSNNNKAHHRASSHRDGNSSRHHQAQRPKKNIMQRLRMLLMAHAYHDLNRPINPEDKQDIATHRITKAPDLVNMMYLLEPDSWKELIDICSDSKIKTELEATMQKKAAKAGMSFCLFVKNLEPGLSFNQEDGSAEMIIQVQVNQEEHVALVPNKVNKFKALGFVASGNVVHTNRQPQQEHIVSNNGNIATRQSTNNNQKVSHQSPAVPTQQQQQEKQSFPASQFSMPSTTPQIPTNLAATEPMVTNQPIAAGKMNYADVLAQAIMNDV